MLFTVKRKIDKLGRVGLPIDIREAYDMPIGTPLRFELDGERVCVIKDTCENNKSRLIDPQGRIVLPVEYRRALGIIAGDYLAISPEDAGLYITRLSNR